MGKDGWWIVRAVLRVIHTLLHFLDRDSRIPGTTEPRSKGDARAVVNEVLDAADLPDEDEEEPEP